MSETVSLLLLYLYAVDMGNFTFFVCTKKQCVDCVWNVMAHAQRPDFVVGRNGRVRLNWQGHQFSRLLGAEVCASAVVMLDTSCSDVVWRVLDTHSTRQVPLPFPSRALPCAITFQLDSTTRRTWCGTFNPLNAELNPICHLLTLLGAHHILHVSRIRVKNPASYI